MPPVAVPPLSDSVQVSVVVPETFGWSVNVSVPVDGSMAGRTANRAGLVLPVSVEGQDLARFIGRPGADPGGPPAEGREPAVLDDGDRIGALDEARRVVHRP